MKGNLLEVKDLSLYFKVFGGTLKVLDGVNFTVGDEEKVGLIGETGSGKTTTMKAIMKILGMTTARISKGEILFKGRDILKMNKAEVQEITPIVIPIIIIKIKAKIASSKLAGRTRLISSETGCFVTRDIPKSPWRTSLNQ